MRYCSLGGLFGGGNYFANNASYSTSSTYAHLETEGPYKGEHGVFYASVLIGEPTTNQVDSQGRNKAPMIPGSK